MDRKSIDIQKALFALALATLGLGTALPAASQGKEEVSEATKARLQRQEAASKLFEKPKPDPATVKPAAAKAKEPSAASQTTRAPQPAVATDAAAVASSKSPEGAKPVEIPAPAAATSEPAPRPTVAQAAPSSAARPVSRVDPEFPREAIQAGVDKGTVKARMTLDASGKVTHVEIVEAVPRRLFDRSVVKALSDWKFNEGAAGRTVETDIEFKR